MASYGVRITQPLPTIGQVVWGGPLNDLLQAIVDVLAAQVSPDGIDLSGDLDFHGNRAIDLTALGFVAGAIPSVGPAAYSDGTDLWYVDGNGTHIQITADGGINITVSGGIGGDYIAAGAHLNYVASTNSYTHTDASGDSSVIDGGGLVMRSGGSTGYVKLSAPATIGSTQYALTFPSALPALGSVLTVDATGSLNFLPYSAAARVVKYPDISLAAGKNTGTPAQDPTYDNDLGWALQLAGTAVDMNVDVKPGDVINAVAFGTDSGHFTGSIRTMAPNGNVSIVARKSFNEGTTGEHFLSSSVYTMTGTLPFTVPATGSVRVRYEMAGVQSLNFWYTLKTDVSVLSGAL